MTERSDINSILFCSFYITRGPIPKNLEIPPLHSLRIDSHLAQDPQSISIFLSAGIYTTLNYRPKQTPPLTLNDNTVYSAVQDAQDDETWLK